MKKIPIGRSDFKDLITGNYYYVDKSLFIKDIIDDGAQVILLPRPRRFGKTLNLNMLRYFYEKTKEDNRYLFKGLNIDEYKDIMNMQGKYPVIYVTFKDVKNEDCNKCFEKLKELISKELISKEYHRHKYLLDTYLDEIQQIYFKKILLMEASEAQYETSLKNLSEFLSGFHKKKVVILIDEYDVPIQSGYLNGYYDEIIGFMRNFLSAGFKDNEYLEKGVLTGILRVAKESIFSGLNNLKVSTLLSYQYSDSFGFVDEEVEKILKYYKIEFQMDKVRDWYNGYIFGNKIIYNPWSILNYVDNYEEGFKAHWVNTSSNDLPKLVLTKGGEKVKQELEDLIQNRELVKIINEDIVMGDITKGSENVWSFLLFSGYLKVVHREYIEGELQCSLKIPNLEVKYLYKQIILSWFKDSISNDKFNLMIQSLLNGDVKTFGKILKEFVLSSVSYFDVSGKEVEKVYHAFVLGMLIALGDKYEVKSNRESGYGRYDVIVIPKDINKIGIIFEFKKVDEDENENLEKAVEEALKQISEKNYKQELVDRGIKNIIEIGVAFQKKEMLLRQRKCEESICQFFN